MNDRHMHEGELPCILHKTRGFSCYNVFYITTTLTKSCLEANMEGTV